MHLHQTHWGSKVPTPENGEHYFLIIIFWWLVCLQLSQTCLFTLAWRATCQRPGGTGRLSWHLTRGQPVIWTWTRTLLCGKDPAWGNLAVGQHSWYNSFPPVPPPPTPQECGFRSHVWNVPFSSLLCYHASIFLGRGIIPSSVLPFNKAIQTKRYQAPEHQWGEYTHILGLSKL